MVTLPALPGPVLLAETDAPFEIVKDCPAAMVMLPPEPESGSVPIVPLWIPPGWPVLKVPEIPMVSEAVILMLPPRPLLVVPLLV